MKKIMRRLKKGIVIGSVVLLSTGFFAFTSDFFEVAKQMEIYTTLFKELNMYYIDEINPAQLTESAINNMLIGSAGVKTIEITKITRIAIRHFSRYCSTGNTPMRFKNSMTSGS